MDVSLPKTSVVKDERDEILIETDLSIIVPANALPVQTRIEGVMEGDTPTSTAKALQGRLEEVKKLVESSCHAIQAAVADLPSAKKVAVEIGIKFAGEAGVPVLAKASAEASLKVTVEW